MLSVTTLAKIVALGVVGVALALSGSIEWPNQVSAVQSGCPAPSPERFVQTHLTSVEDLKVVSINPTVMHTAATDDGVFDVPLLRKDTDGSLNADFQPVHVSRYPIAHEGFRMREMRARERRLGARELWTFRGGLAQYPNSLAALYVRPSHEGSPGFVSGYLLENVNVTDPNMAQSGWHFIEPARPLMMGIAQRSESLSTADVGNCLSEQAAWHVIYQVRGTSDAFSMQVEPARDVKGVVNRLEAPFNIWTNTPFSVNAHIANLTDPELNLADDVPSMTGHQVATDVTFLVDGDDVAEIEDLPVTRGDPEVVSFSHEFSSAGRHTLIVRADGNEMKRVVNVVPEPADKTTKLEVLKAAAAPEALDTMPFVGVADDAFFDLYSSMVQKTWWEGQVEVINLMEAFFREKIEGFGLRIQALEAWTKAAPSRPGRAVESALASAGIEPHEVINAYTLLCNFAQDVPSEVPNYESDAPGLTHLFSGRDLGPIPQPMVVSDAGGGFCQNSCSQVGGNVVGLAQGVGGYKRGSTLGSKSCANSLTQPESFDPVAYHGLSQHGPHNPHSADSMGSDSRENANAGYQATLYQRFILLAHEIGHNLGANHSSDEASIMYTPLQNTIRFKLDRLRQRSDREIRQCWKTC